MGRYFIALILLYLAATISECLAKERVYYVAAVDIQWDYAPTGVNSFNGKLIDDDEDAAVFTKKSANRIGRVYKKTVYREYTDKTFSKQAKRETHLGILGPVIRGEEGDKITIYFKNMANRSFTMHPHGTFYRKSSEGAKYLDKTSGDDKKDDAVPPGATHKYEWFVKAENTPKEGDEKCLPWVYHSHFVPSNDINTGTVGILLTCKKGSLDSAGKRSDVNKEMFVLLSVFDENKSWYLDENLKQNNITPASINKEDDAFKESNLMHSMNGLFYGNLQGLDVCLGDKVAWYMAVLGNEVDMHTANFLGNTIISDQHRTDTVSIFPAKTSVSIMEVKNPGKWIFSCQVTDHFSGGMFTLYNAQKCNKTITKPTLNGKVRQYFIAAEEVEWDYGPSGRNLFDGGFLNKGSSSATFFSTSTNRIGGKYIKAVYIEYTDATFSEKKNRSSEEIHLGLIGPVIKAEVGDQIRVVFMNKASRNFSIFLRGVVSNDSTANYANPNVGISPNSSYVYEWTVPDFMAPSDLDWPCISYMYSSSVNPVKDMYSGLIGPLVTCKRGSLKSNGIPNGYDTERFILMAVMDENKSLYLDKNMDKYCLTVKCAGISKEDADFMESNKMHQINGFMYGNLNGLEFCKGQKILWHTFVVGTEVDMHAIYFHGNTFESAVGNRKDSLTLFPGAAATLKMVPDNVGSWGLVCRVSDHYSAGMKASYRVKQCNADNSTMSSKVKRTFYIGIIETEWDYAESNRSLTHGYLLDEHDNSKVFTKRAGNRIGKTYKKAVYREYTDSKFNKQKPIGNAMKHLGVLGPIIRAEEGDEVVIVLKNMATRQYSINPHGAFYSKEYEGAVYKDGSSKKNGTVVAPGSTFTYHWYIPSRSAPGARDGPCVTWAYYSAVNPIKDVNTGLIGPLITCKKGTLDSNGKRKDVDKEFALLFTVLDENESWYLDENIQKYALTPQSVSKEDEGFKESNKMHAINGYIYGNGPNNGNYLTMNVDEKIAWYLLGVGNEVDIHTVHFHANNFVHRTNAEHLDDVYNVFPGVFETLEMKVTNPGTWLLHCHVHDHLEGGMETRYVVLPAKPATKQPTTKDSAANWTSFPSFVLFLMGLVFTQLIQ